MPRYCSHIGFTGTQAGMNDLQKRLLRETILTVRAEGPGEFHHGDCEGADAEAHDIAEALGFKTVIHPPSNPAKRAWKNGTTILTTLPYLDRNHAIVDATEILIATPKGNEEELRSGTWSTVRYARKIKRPHIVIRPDGHHLIEYWDL
jgi:hypothetical protein